MSFNSLHFLIFLPIVLIVQRLLPHKFKWVWLLLASYYFYMSWNAWLIFLIVGTTAVSYFSGLFISRTQSTKIKKLLLALTLVICLGVLVFFKYFNFLMQSVFDFLNLFSMNLDDFALNIILPIGISFYTFQTLSYVVDVYRGTIKAEIHFGYYALFVSFFPQLVAGPIERPQNLLPQLHSDYKATKVDMEEGLRFILLGFFKKIAVADFIGKFVNSVFSNVAAANGLSLWLAVILFTVQIYCDFSGYSDIATGAARMMGIKLMKNFDRPFSSTSMREFGTRWHISLNSWFRDYLYFPLGGNRKGRRRKYLNTIIVFSISGLWHGASWTFFIWGALTGLFIIIEDLLRPFYHKVCDKLHIDNKNGLVIILRRIILVLIVSLSSVFFRSQSVPEAGLVLSKMFTDIGFGNAYLAITMSAMSINWLDMVQLMLSLTLLVVAYDMCFPKPQQLFSASAVSRTASGLRFSAYIFFVLLIAFVWLNALAGNDTSAFIYFQF